MQVYYIQINALCFLLQMIMLLTVSSRRGMIRSRQKVFCAIVITTAVMCFSDTVAWLLLGKSYPGTATLL